MPRSLRPLLAVGLSLGSALSPLLGCHASSASAGVAVSPTGQGPTGQGPTGQGRIEWQRTLEDAEILARTEHRPLFIAVNMDGESASDRIWRENYRDPVFVAAANCCVCVAASVFRHNPRDHDERGNRIPCPRFGCVTCGEHMAMEPKLFEKLLADGERVAPRHALVMPDGKKVFDLSLCFDLHDIDRALFAATKDLSPRATIAVEEASWEELAARRDHLGRAAFECRMKLVSTNDLADALAALTAVARAGDAGSLDALRLVGSCSYLPPRLRTALVVAAKERGLAADLAAFWRARVEQPEARFDYGSHHGTGADDEGVALLARLDGNGVATRSLLLAQCTVVGSAGKAIRALRESLSPEAMAEVEAALQATGGSFMLESELARAPATPEQAPSGDEMPEASALDRMLTELDAVPQAGRDAEWNARFAKASLDLGRRRLDEQRKDSQLLFEDAEMHWKKALAADARRADWWIERARTAHFLGRYVDQVAYGQLAFDEVAAGRVLDSPLRDPTTVEALRWVGDGHARLIGERAKGDAATELRGIAEGMRAFARVAASAFGTAKDWLSLASFCGALGLHRAENMIVLKAAMRFPADRDLRQYLNATVWNAGHYDTAPSIAAWIANARPDSADARWFAGQARMLVAEAFRRVEAPNAALEDYADAQQYFAEAMSLRADYADNCRLWSALSWLGRGLAHMQADRRELAADCLVEAVRQRASLAGLRDGLGYDVLDLVDKIFEWRDAGPSNVDPRKLLDRLLAAAPDGAFYGLAIADSLVREALRADGRNPHRVERETVDAAGNKVRMPMGLATWEGDEYLQRSLDAACRVRPFTKTPEDRKVLAQSATIWAERQLERDKLDGVAAALAEAAIQLDMQPPPSNLYAPAARAFAAQLRELLGVARPRQRDGR